MGNNTYWVIFIMTYGKYKNARNASWQCLIDNNVRVLPVKVTEIAINNGILIQRYSTVEPDRLKPNESGSTYIFDDKIVIVYRDSEPSQRCRFTIAHELGHIFLGHTLIDGKYARKFDLSKPEIEIEADVFASRLLAPACVLWGLNLHTADEIAKVCNISLSAGKVRAERMRVLYEHNKFLTSPLEQHVFKQFEGFIQSKQNNI